MLRIVVGVLVAANLLFWGWSQGWLGGAEDAANGTDEANRLRRQIAPEQMHILPADIKIGTPPSRDAAS